MAGVKYPKPHLSFFEVFKSDIMHSELGTLLRGKSHTAISFIQADNDYNYNVKKECQTFCLAGVL